MKKLLENETLEEKRKSQLTLYALNALVIVLFIMARSVEMRIFEVSFFLELFFVMGIVRFYSRAHKNKNYALWGFTTVMGSYFLLRILHFTFINNNILVLYIAFLGLLFLVINSYFLSSPLYFPRVQWWEYDFRYRGDLKGSVKYKEDNLDMRLTDIRRNALSFLAFEKLKLGTSVEVEVPFGSNKYYVKGRLKTSREDIPGRPIRYGVLISFEDEEQKRTISEFKKMWKLSKKANIRRKFADYQEENEL